MTRRGTIAAILLVLPIQLGTTQLQHFPFSSSGSASTETAITPPESRGLKPAARNTETEHALATEPPHSDDAATPARIDEILTQLEQRGDDLKDILCKVRFEEVDNVNLVTRVKTGEVRFMLSVPSPLFSILFDRTVVDGIVGKREWYFFDGRWMYQGLERLAQVTKTEYAREGEPVDLFDLETAPFPVPFGQKKEKILRNFNVELRAPVAGDPPNTDHLVCVPKPASAMYGKYDRMEFFVSRGVHLPTRIIVVKNDGYETNTADFPDLSAKSINTGLMKKDFARPSAWRKYKEVVEPLPPIPGETP